MYSAPFLFFGEKSVSDGSLVLVTKPFHLIYDSCWGDVRVVYNKSLQLLHAAIKDVSVCISQFLPVPGLRIEIFGELDSVDGC